MNMKSMSAAVAAGLVLVALPMKTEAQPRVNLRLEYGAPSVSRYDAALAEYYRVPCRDICEMRDAGVADEDIPVILYIYTHSHYSLRQIYSLRLRGATWANLSNWCGVPLRRERYGPPFGKAYGYYRNGPGRDGNEHRRWDREDEDNHGTWEGDRDQEERREGDDD